MVLGALPGIPGLPVSVQEYPAGVEGINKAVNKIIEYTLDGRTNPLARQMGEGIIRAAGYSANAPLTNRQVMEAFNDYVRANIRYRPDATLTETVQKPTITLCVPGAAACIPVGDCDDGTAVYAWLLTGYGIPVRLLIQHFGTDTDHILVEGQTEDGVWLPIDFSNFNSENMPVGWKPSADSESLIDPFDDHNLKLNGARDVEFVTVGRVPNDLPRRVGALPARLVGAITNRPLTERTFETITSDLANQVESVITAGDAYLSASPPEYDAAISAYKAAGQAGATNIGPAIDSVGFPNVTQPLTQQAWAANGPLQALTGNSVAIATQAQAIAKSNLSLYRQAILNGIAAQGGNPPSPKPVGASSVGQNVATAVAFGAAAGLAWAFFRSLKRGRR